MIFWVIEHGGTQTVFSALTHKYIVIHTAFASFPKLIIICKLRISYRLVTQIAVDLYYSKAGSKAKDFRIRIFLPGKLKNLLFDLFRNSCFSKFRRYNEAAVGYKLFVSPCFDITKANPFVFF